MTDTPKNRAVVGIDTLLEELRRNRDARNTSVYASDKVYRLLDYIDELRAVVSAGGDTVERSGG